MAPWKASTRESVAPNDPGCYTSRFVPGHAGWQRWGTGALVCAASCLYLLRFVDLLPFAYTLGIISCLSSRGFKRLGDIAAGTLVVYREQPIERPNLPEAEALPAPFVLDFAEQRAVLAFAERGEGLSTARRAELAGILAEPLQVDASQAEGRINGIARGLLGPT